VKPAGSFVNLNKRQDENTFPVRYYAPLDGIVDKEGYNKPIATLLVNEVVVSLKQYLSTDLRAEGAMAGELAQ
jgi:hypothetical protein